MTLSENNKENQYKITLNLKTSIPQWRNWVHVKRIIWWHNVQCVSASCYNCFRNTCRDTHLPEHVITLKEHIIHSYIPIQQNTGGNFKRMQQSMRINQLNRVRWQEMVQNGTAAVTTTNRVPQSVSSFIQPIQQNRVHIKICYEHQSSKWITLIGIQYAVMHCKTHIAKPASKWRNMYRAWAWTRRGQKYIL